MKVSLILIGLTYLIFAGLWAMAFASMRMGNPTAINAVVGIPAGAAISLPFAWATVESARR